jgi:hypothetical protein
VGAARVRGGWGGVARAQQNKMQGGVGMRSRSGKGGAEAKDGGDAWTRRRSGKKCTSVEERHGRTKKNGD